MEAMSAGEIRTDEPAALDVSVRLLLAEARENRWSKLLTVISFSRVASPKDVSNPAQHRIAWFCHSKIAGNIRFAPAAKPGALVHETEPNTFLRE
jgi:hypothetical protein